MAGYSAFGTKLLIGTSTIGSLTAINGPAVSVDTIDVSAHDSTNAYREFVAGLIDGGEISVEGNLASATAGNVFMTAIESRTTQSITVTFPSGTAGSWSMAGIVTGFETQSPFDGKLGFSASVKVTGKPTLAST